MFPSMNSRRVSASIRLYLRLSLRKWRPITPRIPMADRIYNVLFLCTGNSARSILAESLLNTLGPGKFRAFSAGSYPKGQVHPMAVELLKRKNLPTENLRSKSWNEFAAPGAPPIDFIFTVCDNAAGEVCPVWPGKPMTAHWGVPEPGAVGSNPEQLERSFRDAFVMLDRRISLFLALPLASLDQLAIKKEIDRIGQQ